MNFKAGDFWDFDAQNFEGLTLDYLIPLWHILSRNLQELE